MITCDYRYKGQIISAEDFQALLNEAFINEDTSIDAVLFSLASKKESRVNTLKSIKHEGKLESGFKERFILDGDVSYAGEDGIYSISGFLDSGLATLAKDIYEHKDIEDYRREKKNLLVRRGVDEDVAELIIQGNIDNWERLSEDARLLHRLVTDDSIIGSPDSKDSRRIKFVEKALTLMSSDSPFRSESVLRNLFDEISRSYMIAKGKSPESPSIKNIGLTAKLKNISHEIFGHIDYAFIDNQGNLKIYNFKVTSENPSSWVFNKRNKFRLEGALIKQMLIANGILISDVGEIDYNIIPLRVFYNSDYTEVSKVVASSPESLDFDGSSNYVSRKFDSIARLNIDVPFGIENVDPSSILEADEVFENAFLHMKVASRRIYKSAVSWIKTAPSVGDTESLIIKEVNEPECRYRVILYGETYDIKDFSSKENNREIINLVEKHLSQLNSELGSYSSQISTAVEKAFVHKIGFIGEDIVNSTFLNQALTKYLPIDKETPLEWEFNKELIDYNILLFRNVNTNQLDVIVLTGEDLEQLGDFKRGATNILGSFKMNGASDGSTLRGDMGNIELMRGMILLNSLLPSLNNIKLGELSVLSINRNGLKRSHPIKLFKEEHFNHFLNVVKQEAGLHSLRNNFKGALYMEPLEDIIRTYHTITEKLTPALGLIFEEKLGFNRLTSVNLDNLVDTIFDLLTNLNDHYFKNQTPLAIYELAHPRTGSYDTMIQSQALLYEMLTNAYAYYTNQTPEYQHELSKFDINAFTAPTIPDYNIRLVVTNMQTAVDSIAYEQMSRYDKNISGIVLQYYKDCGYSDIQNLTIGNQLHLFDNLYQTDEKGDRILLFKNPYDESNDLKDHERIFLKKALYYLHQLRCERKGLENRFTGYNDSEINEYINNDKKGESYLWVPLMRATKQSQRQLGWQSRWDRLKRGMKIILKSSDWFAEVVERMTPEERDMALEGVDSLHLNNPFDLGDNNANRRLNYINKHGVGFFETNLENILTEYMAKAVEVDKLNKFLLSTKALLLQLHIMGNDSELARKIIDKEMTAIKEYITLNAYNLPTMEPSSLKLVAALSGTKQTVTFLNLAGNMSAFFRDIINGFGENFLRGATHYQTDLKAKYISEAYAYVIANGRSNAMDINLLSKLNIRYRLSNTDLARIKERLITGRNGVYNWDNWAYATLRSPDFLNRLTLFVARCMQDGVWDAYSMENGELKYEVAKDKRFTHFINDEYTHPDYAKEKALFILHIKNWNKEHPDLFIDWASKILPEPYSDLEILAIKNVANNIYGSYDRSLKANYEFTALGWAFTMYTTWMNGIWNNWAMKPDKYNIHHMETRPELDENGNVVCMDDNGNILDTRVEEDGTVVYLNQEGEIVENPTPVLKEVPVIVQGLWYTLKDALNICLQDDGGIKAAWDYINGDLYKRLSFYHGLSLLFIAFIFMILFKEALTPMYNDSKKKSSNLSTAEKLLVSLSYRSLNGARDSFAGPLNIFEYFGEQLDPPIYRVPIKFVKDTGNFIFGDKTFASLVTGNIALARTFKDIAN